MDSPTLPQQYEKYMPKAAYPRYPSGVRTDENAIYRYAHDSSDFPNLTIIDPIYDSQGNVIMPGYYGLALSDDQKFLLLLQTRQIIAKLPVFKLEEEKKASSQVDPKFEKEKKREEKRRAKKNKKLAIAGVPQGAKQVYMNASIEYQKDGNYYVIKYERDQIRAWAAIK